MKIEQLVEIFEKYDSEFLEFERIENKVSNRPDLHAFLLLDKLVPGKNDMVSAAGHDEIWLDVDLDNLTDVITDEQILELVRCGVRYDDENESLAMYV